jgi:signal transduction histidine kinase/PAS domain-containing protein
MVENIKTEILLELVFSINSGLPEDQILQSAIPVFIKKLNCFAIVMLKPADDSFNDYYILPFAFKKSLFWAEAKEKFLREKGTAKPDDIIEIQHQSKFLYAYQLSNYGMLIFARKSPFSKLFKNELKPVINYLSNSLIQSIQQKKREETEFALKESEDRYRSFISQVTEGVYRLECDKPMDLSLSVEEQIDFIYDHMFIAECNDSFMNMYGISDRKDIIGKGHLYFHGGRHNPVNRNQLRVFINSGYHTENGITKELNTMGKQMFISNNALGIFENNQLIRMWGTQIDITEKMMDDQVKQMLYTISNATLTTKDFPELIEIIRIQLENLFETNNFYIAFYDEATGMLSTQNEKDEKDKIQSWPAEKSATGYVIKHQKPLLASDIEILKLCEEGEIVMIGTPSKVWLGVPMIVNKRVFGAIVVQSYDNPDAYTEKDKLLLEFISGQISISVERKKAEQDLKDALVKAQESDRLKTAFLANMSHEIRTPMNGILGFTGLLKEPKLTGEKQQRYIGNDIINISKVESGQMEVSITETNINEQIEFIYTFFKPEVIHKGLKIFIKNFLPANEVIVKTDKEKVYAILTNLVKNAIKFTNEGTIEIGYEKKDKYLEFFVKDSGVGIRQAQVNIIFERFRQGSESLSRNYEGAGLGLSISKAYVEMLGGEIWVESVVGKGSIFYFTLPYNMGNKVEKADKIIAKYNVEEQDIKDLKILIAEDDEISEMLISMVIGEYGKEILKVKTGIEAVEVCRSNPDIDLVLMDIKMPDMDGYEATKKIRQFNNSMIIIAQTAFALSGEREKAIEAGCNDYISKPYSQKLLSALVKKHLI